MGKIDKFLAKPVEVTIGGEQLMIRPFTVSDLQMVTDMGSKDDVKKNKAIKQAISKIFKQIDSEVTDEQLDMVSLTVLEDVMAAIGTANNIDMSDAKAKLMEELKK